MPDELYPWSVKILTAEIHAEGLHRDLTASPADCAALAKIANVRGISGLKASFDIAPEHGGRFSVSGTVSGTVAQTCVVTLDDMDTLIEEPVDVVFASEEEVAAALAQLSDVDTDDQTPDPPEAIKDAKIDLGHLAAELFVLAIDPYPRKPGASFDPIVTPEAPEDHPFAALAALKGDKSK